MNMFAKSTATFDILKQDRYDPANVRAEETFDFCLELVNSSFLRKQESSHFKTFWIPAFAGMTKKADLQISWTDHQKQERGICPDPTV
jgi:hypothetical protein